MSSNPTRFPQHFAAFQPECSADFRNPIYQTRSYISPRADRSIGRKRGREYQGVWREKHPDAPVIIRDIGANPPSAVSEAWIAGVHSPRDQHTAAMRESVEVSDVLIEELLTATEVVIATPI